MAGIGRAIRVFAWLLAAVALLFSGTARALLDHEDYEPRRHRSYPLGTVIAVDLGNTNSCVAGYGPGGHAESMFHRCIPSWIAFPDDGGVLVGDDARNYAAVNPQAAFSGFKRLLGQRTNPFFFLPIPSRVSRLYEGGFVQRVIENLPYKVVEKDVRPHIQMETKDGVVRHLSIEAMTATVFAKLKDMAEAHLGRKVQHAVFTLPQHYCTEAARDAVLDTGNYAGLHAVRILDEPIAAAVAYGLHGKLRDEGNVLVLHVGGGTAEASVLTFADGVFEFLGAHLEPFFGGDDFDRRVMDHFIGLVRDKYGRDISNDRAALRKLRAACEDAKKTLSGEDLALVNVESLVDGVDLSEPLTRAKFEELNHDLFPKVIELVDTAMSQAELGKEKRELIDEVILIGGSTMIPKVRELIKDYFEGKKELNTKLKPDEAVAFGATLLSHPSASGYPCMGVNNRHQIGGASDNCYAYGY
ncbi:luminal-binding protein 4 [Setaria italica]|uniref:luminal-binding protein 4 n=1 Tax=Setaria italica TaxID=4555 RepID=UPI000BE53DDD|nr:luminal-binding protein 4 [Setaria italica]